MTDHPSCSMWGDLAGLRREFEQSLDAYLDSCAELGRAPDTPFKGTFNLRVSPDIHRRAAMLAGGRSLNAFVAEAIAEKISRSVV